MKDVCVCFVFLRVGEGVARLPPQPSHPLPLTILHPLLLLLRRLPSGKLDVGWLRPEQGFPISIFFLSEIFFGNILVGDLVIQTTDTEL